MFEFFVVSFVTYLIIMMDSLKDFIIGVSIIWLIISAGCIVIIALAHTESEVVKDWTKTTYKKLAIWLIVVPVCLLGLGKMTPSTKNAVMIIGAGAAYTAVTSDTAKSIGGRVVDLINQRLDALIESGELPTTEEKSKNEQEKES